MAIINGTIFNDSLTGTIDADILNGGLGNDVLNGGTGNDTYLFNLGGGQDTIIDYDSKAGNVDTIRFGAGIAPADVNFIRIGMDLVLSINGTTDQLRIQNWYSGSQYQIESIEFSSGMAWYGAELQSYTQNLTAAIVGTDGNDNLSGSRKNDTLVGGAGNDTLNGGGGDDTLYGGTGADKMTGGSGNDIYLVDNTADIVIESSNNDIDTVRSSVSYTLSTNVENLTLTGNDSINATGNSLNNILTGNAGSNILDGGAGADTMSGGLGDDIYIMDNINDMVFEGANGGIDTVLSSVSYTLSDRIENLTLTGSSAINGTDNVMNNVLTGNSAANTLTGGLGKDILTGGLGNDILKDTAGNNLYIGGTGNDTINTSIGYDIIAFNRGDGQDMVTASSGLDNTLSLGGGIRNADLAFHKSGNDLILDVGAGEQIILQGWYASTANKSVLTLQMIEAASPDFNPSSTDTLVNNRIELFDFAGLVAGFDSARASNPALASWSLSNALQACHVGESDSAALGGDLTYQYGMSGSLEGVSLAATQILLSDMQFGQQAQALHLL